MAAISWNFGIAEQILYAASVAQFWQNLIKNLKMWKSHLNSKVVIEYVCQMKSVNATLHVACKLQSCCKVCSFYQKIRGVFWFSKIDFINCSVIKVKSYHRTHWYHTFHKLIDLQSWFLTEYHIWIHSGRIFSFKFSVFSVSKHSVTLA